MKQSKYNLIFEHSEKRLIFNSMSCALAESNDACLDMIDSIDTINESHLDENQKRVLRSIKKGGYIIEDDIDELSLLKFKSYENKFGSHNAHLTILPTLACNFECQYCFENHKNIHISDSVKDAIYKYVEHLARKGNTISVTWYGGEPLLAKKAIWDMSEKIINICETHDVKYSAVIVTNGYLIDDETVKKMVASRISSVNTTLDGPPDVHNSMRKSKRDNIGTFDTIIKNIKKVKNSGINVHIRINVNKINVDQLENLLDILGDNELRSCGIDLGQIKTYTDKCSFIADTCLTTEKFALQTVKYHRLFEKKNFFSSYCNYPTRIANYCRKSHSLNSLIIGPRGELYSCWVEVGDEKLEVGNIWDVLEEKEIVNMHRLNYFLWSPFNYQECIDCQVLPICMGGCPNCAKQTNKPDCQIWKYNIIGMLRLMYDKKGAEYQEIDNEKLKYIVESSTNR